MACRQIRDRHGRTVIWITSSLAAAPVERILWHWTAAAHVESIMAEGLRPGSWLCEHPDDWSGEVLLGVSMPVDFGPKRTVDDPEQWQCRAWEGVPPGRVWVQPGWRAGAPSRLGGE